jgi:tRNA 2-thiocytidine biosynthesis protein TtcA
MNQNLNLHFPIARPPWTKLGRKLESMCRKALYEFDLLKDVKKVAVALSGGKDSLSLLYLLKAISGRGFPEFELYAVHVGGAFSCGAGVSEGFLRGICQELGVTFLTCAAKQERDKLECYSCSRERRTLIFEAVKSVGATTVAFGHHRDDSVQTLLMNLLHKGEFAAMLPKVPMHDYGVTIIRPLIFVREEEIVEFAKMYGFTRVVCQCPVGQESMRKKSRDLIAELEKEFPNARDNLSYASLLYGSQKALKK